MNTIQLNTVDVKEPAYINMGGFFMEKLRTNQPILVEEFVSRLVKESLETSLGGKISCSPLSKIQNSQTAQIITKVRMNIVENVNQENISRLLPELSRNEISGRGAKMILAPFKKRESRNAFGSPWNEFTTKLAANRLGFPDKKLKMMIDAPGPQGQKLRETQASIAKEAEIATRNTFANEFRAKADFLIPLETLIGTLVEETRTNLKKMNATLSKSEKGKVIEDVVTAFIKIANFSPGQQISFKDLRKTLLKGRLNHPINLVALHCLSFNNSEKDGICVSPSAKDFVATNNDGSRVLITQSDSLVKVEEFADILASTNISFKIIFLLVDSDAFVMNRQKKEIDSFAQSLNKMITLRPAASFQWEIEKSNNIINPQEFSDEWEKRNENGDSLTESLVNDEFRRLQGRTLPPEMKTRSFARKTAKRNFLVQFSFGATIPRIFNNSITLQRSRAHQQATRLFKLGGKMLKTTPIILAHWKEMTKVE